MSADVQLAFHGVTMTQRRYIPAAFADKALRATARLWFVAAILGQLLFAFAVAAFYGGMALRGDYEAWNRFMFRGYVSGDRIGNAAVATHLISAVVIILAGAIQFVPWVRNRFPAFHRWTGRVYMLTAFTVSIAGLYMTWIRGAFGDVSQHIGSTGNAILIWICAIQALRHAIRRDFRTHRRWTLRLFLVVSAAWFFRATFFLSLLLFKGPAGFDPNTFRGPFLTVMSFAQYLVPLGVAELYFRAQDRPGVLRRLAMSAGLVVLTIAMTAGVFAISMILWVPAIKAAFDERKSIAFTLSRTIESGDIERGIEQYRSLAASEERHSYNFDEGELNRLGYRLLRAGRLAAAIRVFQLNAEAYPNSSNVYDSLGEAYMQAGNRALAIANYRKALALDSNKRSAIAALQKLGQ